MARLCKTASWFCNCLAVALLIVGLLAVPEQARADGGGGDGVQDICPCGGKVPTPNNCVSGTCPNSPPLSAAAACGRAATLAPRATATGRANWLV